MHSKKLIVVATALTGLLALSALSSTGGSEESKTLRYGAAATLASSPPGSPMGRRRRLPAAGVRHPAASGAGRRLDEGLATEWAWDDALTTFTLTLRDDVNFTDGEASHR